MINIKEASIRSGKAIITLRRAIKSDHLKATKKGGQWFISAHDLEAFTSDKKEQAPPSASTNEVNSDLLEMVVDRLKKQDKLIKQIRKQASEETKLLHERLRESHILIGQLNNQIALQGNQEANRSHVTHEVKEAEEIHHEVIEDESNPIKQEEIKADFYSWLKYNKSWLDQQQQKTKH